MPFLPSTQSVVQSAYGAASDSSSGSSGYLEAASQYAPILKTLLFDDDPRIEHEKKSKELASAIASYKAAGAGFSKNALAGKIRSLQAEIKGLAAQADVLETSESLTVAGKAAGIGLLVAGVGVAALVGYLVYEKAATERARRRQITSSEVVA